MNTASARSFPSVDAVKPGRPRKAPTLLLPSVVVGKGLRLLVWQKNYISWPVSHDGSCAPIWRSSGGAVCVNKHQGAVAALSSLAQDALQVHSTVGLARIDTCWYVTRPSTSIKQSIITEHGFYQHSTNVCAAVLSRHHPLIHSLNSLRWRS